MSKRILVRDVDTTTHADAPDTGEEAGDVGRFTTTPDGDPSPSSEIDALRVESERLHARRAEIFASAGLKGKAITLPLHCRITGAAYYGGVLPGMTGVCTYDGPDYPTLRDGSPNPNADVRFLKVEFPQLTTTKGAPYVRVPHQVAIDDGFIVGGWYAGKAPDVPFADYLHAIDTRIANWDARHDLN